MQFQMSFVVAEVFNQYSGLMHAVLYDPAETASKADGNYYFKNSYPAEPFITVPKNRVTYGQYDKLYNTRPGPDRDNLLKSWEKTLGTLDVKLYPRSQYRTIWNNMYAVSIHKINP